MVATHSENNVITIEQFRFLIKEGIVDAHGDRMSSLEENQRNLDDKVDSVFSNLHAFETRITACFHELRSDLGKELNVLSREVELTKREQAHQGSIIAQRLDGMTVKLGDVEDTQRNQNKKLEILEKNIQDVQSTAEGNIVKLKKAMDELTGLIDKDTADLLKNIHKEVTTVKNIKVAAVTVFTALAFILCLTLYFQDIFIKFTDLREKIKKASKPPVTEVTDGVKK